MVSNHITEMIPSKMPVWMKEAFDNGQLFNETISKVNDLEEQIAKLKAIALDAARVIGGMPPFLDDQLEDVAWTLEAKAIQIRNQVNKL